MAQRRFGRALVAGLLVAVAGGLAGPAPALAQEEPATPPQVLGAPPVEGLPEGTTIEAGPSGPVLVWQGAEVAIGGSRPELRVGGTLLGYPREVDGGLQLALDAAGLALLRADPAALEVLAGGRRLDLPLPPAERLPGPAEAALPPAPAAGIDPAATGPYSVERLSYDLDPLPVAGFPAPVEVLAEVSRPVGAPGRRPLVLLLHGRHATCFRGGPGGDASGDWPCPAGWQPIPSHLGYRYVTDVLASQGFVAVSISANGINGQDFAAIDGGASARSQLLRHHLDLWARWSSVGGDPWGGRFFGRVDLQRTVLVGHSRGGEGVNRAAIDVAATDPYRIVGIVSYGPTAFGRQVTPEVHSATILPTCDGDVLDLQGQAYVDASRDVAATTAVRSAVIAVGANHNYFNTEWTPGLAVAPANDDWFDASDPVCGDTGSARLTAEEQRRVGAAYTLALVRMAATSDTAMLPLLDGTYVRAAGIGDAEVVTSAVGGVGTLLYRPGLAAPVTLASGMTGTTCAGYLVEGATTPACNGGAVDPTAAPHWQPMAGQETRPAPQAVELAWSGRGAVATFDVPGRTVNLSRDTNLDVRVANDPGAPAAGLGLRVRDSSGRVATLAVNLPRVGGWPGRGFLDRIQARTLRGDLRTASGVDLRRVVSVDVVSTSARGRVWVLDVASSRGVVLPVRPLDLPRVSVSTTSVAEGSAESTIDVELTVDRPLPTAAAFWVQAFDDADLRLPARGFLATVPAGRSGVVARVPVRVLGDELYSPSFGGPVFGDPFVTVSAGVGAVTGDYIGGPTVVEDDPVPVLSVDTRNARVDEGGALTWTLRLSSPAAFLFYLGSAEAPAAATELATDDVDPDWLLLQLGFVPDPPAPLSQPGFGFPLQVFLPFEPGQLTQEVTIPTVADGTAEGEEVVRLRLAEFGPDPTLPPGGLVLRGVVTDPIATTPE